MYSFRWTLTATMLISWSIQSFCIIKHCDPDTDSKREEILKNYPGLRNYLYEDAKITRGRLGTVKFVNHQDQLLHLTAPVDKCLWKMKSEVAEEESKFNSRGYIGKSLYAEPLKPAYVHLIACETDNCVQYFNVVSRPYSKPDFPVQVYTGHAKKVGCTLDHMLKHAKASRPPFVFEWTGPMDCRQDNWDSDDPQKCLRYFATQTPKDCATSSCKVSIDPTYTNQQAGTLPAQSKRGYKKTKVEIKGGKVNGEASAVYSDLSIEDASDHHDGRWRCIVYDKFGVSSDPTRKGHVELEKTEVKHYGVIDIHVKNMGWAIGVPFAIIGVVIILLVLCISLCKQCTDFDPEPDEAPNPEPKEIVSSSETPAAKSTASVAKDKEPEPVTQTESAAAILAVVPPQSERVSSQTNLQSDNEEQDNDKPRRKKKKHKE